METINRRLLRVLLFILGTYLCLRYSTEMEDMDQVKVIMLISVVFMVVDTYVPRVEVVQPADS